MCHWKLKFLNFGKNVIFIFAINLVECDHTPLRVSAGVPEYQKWTFLSKLRVSMVGRAKSFIKKLFSMSILLFLSCFSGHFWSAFLVLLFLAVQKFVAKKNWGRFGNKPCYLINIHIASCKSLERLKLNNQMSLSAIAFCSMVIK